MNARDRVYQLVEKFDREKPGSETEVRIQFVDPLFKALGWDLRDKRQVRHEPSVRTKDEGRDRSKRPDYSFHIGNTTHFFVETKMPHVNLERDPMPAFQLRRYGWSGNTPASVLTDFEEFSVYDCRIQPQRSDPANKARLRYYQYGDYIDKWDELESRFSREAVAGGALREWIEGERIRGFFSVDQAFLREMENWRETLAKVIALHNRDLSQRQLNLLVQRTIDRIVFLRIAEDRDIEAYGRLRSAAGEGKQVYEELKILFNEADDKYNSGLFHFGKDERASDPDTHSMTMHVPDEPLRHIIKNLYFPFSPYEFSVLSADILGQVYEQFLGKVIELSAGGAVRVEEKPEVRKAGGVYYTPTYIVDYIVENTVGKLLDGATPEEAEKLRVLDPACGSGSFLTGAYQYLLDWHLDYYRAHPGQYRNRRRETAAGMILTTAEKRRILLDNIYGVDLDQNAVEVSKLSLLLKMLENENDATGAQTIMFSAGGRILPDLSGNIKWGNSLIGSDFYSGEQMTLFDNEELLRVKPFDWDSEDGFPVIMAAGGFDAVIGNPPWVFTKYVDWGQETKDYLQDNYLTFLDDLKRSRSRQAGKINLFAIFVLKSLKLLKSAGRFSFIVPNNILRTTVYDIVRRQILENHKIERIVDLKAGVFAKVTASTIVLVIQSDIPDVNHPVEIIDNQLKDQIQRDITRRIPQHYFLDNPSYVIDINKSLVIRLLVKKVASVSTALGELVEILNGIATKKNKAGILDDWENENSKPILFGRDVGRYHYSWSGKYVEYVRGKLHRAREERIFLADEKLIMQRIGGILITAYDNDQFYTFNSINNILPTQDRCYDLKYLLGVLNSTLLRFYYTVSFTNDSSLTVNISKTFLDQLPIRTIDFDDPADVARHDKMVELVDRMLDWHKQLPDLTGEARRIVNARIAATDREIDKLVYALYGLSDEEIKIVECG